MSDGTSVNGRGAWRVYGASDLDVIQTAALATFVEQGYHGTSIRSVATRAGLSVPGLYHHYRSKHELLVSLVSFAMDDLIHRTEAALDEAGRGIRGRFGAFVECMALYHAHRSPLAFIAASEIRSLDGEARDAHIASRDREQRLLDEIVVEGVRQGLFSVDDPAVTSRALVTMCTGIAQWYRPGGSLSPEAVALDYRRIAFAAVGASDDAESSPR